MGPELEAPFVPRYDMPVDEVQYHVANYLSQPGAPDDRFVGFIAGGPNQMTNVGRWLETQTFDDSFKNNAEVMAGLYGGVEHESGFLVVLDRKTMLPAGVMRIVGGESAYTMTLADAQNHVPLFSEQRLRNHYGVTGSPNETVWDVATMAVAKPYRGKIAGQTAVSGMLERMFVELGDKMQVDHVFTMLDRKAWKGLQLTGVPFRMLLGLDHSFPYYGSPATSAMYGWFPEFRASVAAQHKKLAEESFIRNLLSSPKPGIREAFKYAMRRRVAARVAGMAALGNDEVDRRLIMPAA